MNGAWRLAGLIGIVGACVAGGPAGAPAAETARTTNTLGMSFVPLPGSHARISVYETRVRDFAAFAADSGWKADEKLYTWIDGVGGLRDGYSWRKPGFAQTDDHPVGGVSWHDAQTFCRWLTEKERTAGRIAANQQYRLPTDAEWSLAMGLGVEAGTTPEEKDSKRKGAYPWGTTWPPPQGAGNYGDVRFGGATDLKAYDDGFAFTAPVGSFAPNALGLYDLSGNVYEWCEDEYRPGDNKRVMRGAAFNSRAQARLLTTERIYFEPDNRAANHGFRCVLAGKS